MPVRTDDRRPGVMNDVKSCACGNVTALVPCSLAKRNLDIIRDCVPGRAQGTNRNKGRSDILPLLENPRIIQAVRAK